MCLSLKTINAHLAKRGFNALLAKGDGYFYFSSGEAVDWLDRTVGTSLRSAADGDLNFEPREAA